MNQQKVKEMAGGSKVQRQCSASSRYSSRQACSRCGSPVSASCDSAMAAAGKPNPGKKKVRGRGGVGRWRVVAGGRQAGRRCRQAGRRGGIGVIAGAGCAAVVVGGSRRQAGRQQAW